MTAAMFSGCIRKIIWSNTRHAAVQACTDSGRSTPERLRGESGQVVHPNVRTELLGTHPQLELAAGAERDQVLDARVLGLL